MPKKFKKLQVSGLDFDDKTLPTDVDESKGFPTIFVNSDVKASTGKMDAQTAHALCK